MKQSKFIFFLPLVFTFLVTCKKEIGPTSSVECESVAINFSHPKKESVDALLEAYVKKGLPGISVLIQDTDGYYAKAAGYADIENNIPFSLCHVSKAASITKLLVGSLTMKLQEEGVLNINDKIDQYIDAGLLAKIDKAEGKTIKQLMNHTTGIFDVITSTKFYLAVLNSSNKNWTQEELLTFAYGEKGYEFEAPYQAHYSNTNTLLLSMCIEKASGKKHDALLRSKIFEPLGMKNTYYQGREVLPSSTAQGYFDLHNNQQIVNVTNLVTGSGNGYGGIFSNVFDLNKFIKALLIDKTLLSQNSLNLMLDFVPEDEDFYTGVGILKKFTNKASYGIGHTGKDLGYSADLFYFPEKGRTLIFFVNYGTNGSSSLKEVFKQFESDIADILLQ